MLSGSSNVCRSAGGQKPLSSPYEMNSTLLQIAAMRSGIIVRAENATNDAIAAE